MNINPSKSGTRRARRPPQNSVEVQELKALKQLVNIQSRSAPPPRWLSNTPISRKIRFGVVAAQTETDFLVRNLLYAACYATSTTVLYPLAYAVRLKQLKIWFTSPTLASSITSTVEWNAVSTGFLLNGSSVSETNTSTTDYVCLVARPPKQSLASWYQAGPTGVTNVLFSFSAPAGAILEIDFDYVPNLTEATYETQTSSGLATGTLYCRAVNSNVLALPPLNSAV